MTHVSGVNAGPGSLGAGLSALRDRWGWVVAIGVLLAVCGLVALANEVVATIAVVLMAGVMMIISGIGEIIHSFAIKTWGKFILWLLIGALYVVAGVVTIMAPAAASIVFTLVVGAALVASGIMRIILAFQMKEGLPWGWVALSGVITVLLGALILVQWPYSGLYILGLFLGVDLLFAGVSWIGMGLALRKAA
jgi:uncharacterized membrane protein HdeD (DUF308 family)